jgi:hypothetical protein
MYYNGEKCGLLRRSLGISENNGRKIVAAEISKSIYTPKKKRDSIKNNRL